jgi:hypothetical protein
LVVELSSCCMATKIQRLDGCLDALHDHQFSTFFAPFSLLA